MTRARRAPIAILLCLAVAGALVLSASSTIHQAAVSRVPVGAPQWAAVALLEVVSVLGTLLAVTRPDLRWRAMGAVAGAALVTLVAGWNAYGAMGLVAPLGLVYAVDLAAAAWRDPKPATGEPAVQDTVTPTAVDSIEWGPADTVTMPVPVSRELRSVPKPADGMTSKQRLRARARDLGVVQSGKTDTQLRADCDAAEKARERVAS